MTFSAFPRTMWAHAQLATLTQTRTNMPARWDLHVVGECRLQGVDGTQTELSAKSKRFAVLVFLALPAPGRRIRRDVLLASFWPELDSVRARNALRVTLHQLRQTLGPNAILGSGEELALDASAVHVDLVDLHRALDAGDAAEWLARPSLELVPGLHVADAGPFEEWLDQQRHTLTARLVRGARAMADTAEAAGDLSRAVIAARAATRLVREDETGLRRLISLLDRSGDRGGALAEYEAFEHWLREQFDAEPSPETRALVQRVRDRTLARVVAEHPDAVSEPHDAPHVAAVSIPASIGATTSVRASAPRARWPRPAVALAAGAVLLFGGGALVRRMEANGSAATERTPLAIAPFRSEIADSASAYLAPALGESIADALPPATAIPYDAGRGGDPRNLAAMQQRLRSFGARSVVSGVLSGRRDSLNLLVTIEHADSRAPPRTMTFHGSERGLLYLRDSAVAAIVRTVGLSAPQAGTRHVPIPEAYQLSLNAAWLLGRRTRAELLQSRTLYTKALEIDPAWADAWLGLARATGSLGYRHFIDYRPGMRASEHAANEALARAPNDGRALIERSLARFLLGDFTGAEADARRASALDSTDGPMQSLIGTWWQWSGNHLDSALFYTRRAQRLGPWDRQFAINAMQIVGCMPDSAAVIREAQRVLDIDPNEPEALETLAWALTRFRRWDDATHAYLHRYAGQLPRNLEAETRGLTGEVRFRTVVRSIRRAQFEEQRRHPPLSPPLLENRVAMYEDLGMRDASLAALAGVIDSLDVHHANMMCAPNLRGFRRDPRTLAIVRRRGWVPAEFARSY